MTVKGIPLQRTPGLTSRRMAADWHDLTAPERDQAVRAAGREGSLHPLLGRRVRSAGLEGTQFESTLTALEPPLLGDYRIHGLATAPEAALIELALAAAAQAPDSGPRALERFALKQALVLSEDVPTTVQVLVGPDGPAGAPVRIFSFDEQADPEQRTA